MQSLNSKRILTHEFDLLELDLLRNCPKIKVLNTNTVHRNELKMASFILPRRGGTDGATPKPQNPYKVWETNIMTFSGHVFLDGFEKNDTRTGIAGKSRARRRPPRALRGLIRHQIDPFSESTPSLWISRRDAANGQIPLLLMFLGRHFPELIQKQVSEPSYFIINSDSFWVARVYEINDCLN